MGRDIKISDVLSFRMEYLEHPTYQHNEKEIQQKGIAKTFLNEDLIEKTTYFFNVEIPEVKIYDQRNSQQCFIYSFLRMVKSILMKYSSDFQSVNFSASYLDFYDKLEKINLVYNRLIDEEHLTFYFVNQVVNRYIGLYGNFHYCKELVDKYGLVLESDMKDSPNYQAGDMIELLKTKIKADSKLFFGKSKEEKIVLKKRVMQDAYHFLSQVYGNPPTHFYFDRKEITPQKWKERYLQDELDHYITLTPYSIHTLQSSFSFLPSIYSKKEEVMKQVSMEKMKQVVLHQLQDDIAVWFSCKESTTLDYDVNILDPNIFDYSKLLQIMPLSKQEQLLGDIIQYDHAMCITGAWVKNDEVKQWKVDNSFGIHGRYQGHLIMTNDFFEQDLITVIVHEKYLQ